MKQFLIAAALLVATEAFALNPPTGLQATPFSQTEIDLAWTDNSDEESGYTVLRSGTAIAQLPANATSFHDSGLAPSTSYTYQVVATATASPGTSATATTLAEPPPPLPPPPPPGGLVAFPTAEGYGKNALGGRGGTVCQVTTLADSGAGSLRDCLTRTGARTVVFRVGGTIVVNSTIRANGRLTIAGQTAPGGGIQIRNGSTITTTVQIFGDDVIVRHVRFSAGATPAQSNNNDSIFYDGRRAIFDHISARWSTDENVDVYGKTTNADITVQWSIIAEPLMGTVAHPGAHAYCIMHAGFRQTLHHSLITDCLMRAPNVATQEQFDMVNTVVHNWNERSLDMYARFGDVNVSAVGNWWQMGASSIRGSRNTPARANIDNPVGRAGTYRVFADHNRSWATPTEASPDQNILPAAGTVQPPFGGSNERAFYVAFPVHPLSVTSVTTPEQAFRDVLAFAGAFPRDAADTRIVNETRNCQGVVLRNESQIPGGFPVIASGTPYPDADADGMDDAWEIAHGVTSHTADADGDGYTNLEEFLNELAGDQDAAGNVIVRAGTGTGIIPAVNCGISIAGGG